MWYMKNLPLLTEICLQEKNIIKEQDMPEALQESSKIMKAGRAYKNIHAILNKYPRKRMGYPQTAGKVQCDILVFNYC